MASVPNKLTSKGNKFDGIKQLRFNQLIKQQTQIK